VRTVGDLAAGGASEDQDVELEDGDGEHHGFNPVNIDSAEVDYKTYKPEIGGEEWVVSETDLSLWPSALCVCFEC
jgi:hypothetical protein